MQTSWPQVEWGSITFFSFWMCSILRTNPPLTSSLCVHPVCPSAVTAAITVQSCVPALLSTLPSEPQGSFRASLSQKAGCHPFHSDERPIWDFHHFQVSSTWTTNTNGSLDHHIDTLPHLLSCPFTNSSQQNTLICVKPRTITLYKTGIKSYNVYLFQYIWSGFSH